MEMILKNKFIIGVVIFYLILIYVGGVMTRGMNNTMKNNEIELSYVEK